MSVYPPADTLAIKAGNVDMTGNANVSSNLTVSGTISGSGAGLTSIPSSAISGTLSQWTTNGTMINYMDGNVGIGVASPGAELHVAGDGAIIVPSGTDAQRPSNAVAGMIRFNIEQSKLEIHDGTDWKQLSFGAVPFSGNTTLIETNTLATNREWAYGAMPGSPRTLLDYVTSFGKDHTSTNDGTATWNNGSATVPLTYRSTFSSSPRYFSSGNFVMFHGDGGADTLDWALFNFGPRSGDYSGNQNYSNYGFFGGESPSQSGASNNYTVEYGYIWGWGDNGWVLLWKDILGTNTGGWSSKQQYWYTAGNTVSSSSMTTNGKRSEYDTMNITHIGFSVGK
tara:strand:- start:115 stop:1131 length:1017 start_codon:yes stop_codon:yes gene_type:complete